MAGSPGRGIWSNGALDDDAYGPYAEGGGIDVEGVGSRGLVIGRDDTDNWRFGGAERP